MKSYEDEFLIRATGHTSQPDREWTRSTLATAKLIAIGAVRQVGYANAEIRNTFGGIVSQPVWMVDTNQSKDPGES